MRVCRCFSSSSRSSHSPCHTSPPTTTQHPPQPILRDGHLTPHASQQSKQQQNPPRPQLPLTRALPFGLTVPDNWTGRQPTQDHRRTRPDHRTARRRWIYFFRGSPRPLPSSSSFTPVLPRWIFHSLPPGFSSHSTPPDLCTTTLSSRLPGLRDFPSVP